MNQFFIIQFFSNFGLIISFLFIPLLANEIGADRFQIGIIVSSYNTSLLIASFLFGRVSDIYGKKRVINAGLFLSSLVFLLHLFIDSIKKMFIIRIAAGLAAGIFPAALASLMFESGGAVGLFAAYGSLGWAAGAIIAGIIKEYNILFLLSSASLFISFLLSLRIKDSSVRIPSPVISFSVLKENLHSYLSFFLRHTGAMGIWTIFPLFLKSLGADKFWIGIIYCVNPLFQSIFMQIVERIKITDLISAGLILTSITFLLYSLCSNHYQILPIQAILALSWSCLYVGELKHLLRNNEERSTAIGTFNSIAGLAGITGPIFGGIASSYGFHGLMLAAVALTIAGLFVWRLKDLERLLRFFKIL